MIFIGDIHGYFTYYLDLVKNITHTPTVQVGDFGLGFRAWDEPTKIDGDHWFIRGNHDDPAVCKKHPNYLGDYGYRKEWDMFFVGGADSIDKRMRVEGVSWWRDEELSYTTLDKVVLPMYEAIKPRVMVTHTCPMKLRFNVLPIWVNDRGEGPSVTERALQVMFDIHQPDIWIFGHWHKHLDVRKNGTRFICLNALQTFEFDTENYL